MSPARRLWLACACASIFALGLVLSCGGDDVVAGGARDIDDASGIQTSGDASLAVDSSLRDGSTDAGIFDSGVDAAIDAGPPGLVTIHAVDEIPFSGSVPVPGAVVVFFDPDGTPHASLRTDDAGSASEIVEPGSSVTVSMTSDAGYPSSRQIISILAVQPGDDLVANGSPQTYVLTPTGAVTLDSPSGDAGNGFEYSSIGCDRNPPIEGLPQSFGAYPSCTIDAGVNAVAWARSDPTYVLKATSFAEAQGISLEDGGTEFSDWSWAPAIETPVVVTGTFPANAITLNVLAALRSGTIVYAPEQFGSSSVADGGIVDPTSLALGLPPSGLIDNIVYDAELGYPAGDSNAMSDVVTVGAYADGFSVDVDAFPPFLTSPSSSFNASSRVATFAWSATGPLDGFDGEIAQIGWTAFNFSTYVDVTWTIVAPPGTSLVPPALTSELLPDSEVPSSGARFPSSVLLQGVDPSHGYSRYRAHYGDYASTNYETFDGYPVTPVRIRNTSINF